MTAVTAPEDSPILFTSEMVAGLRLEAARPGQGKNKSRRPIKAPTTTGRFLLSFNHGVPEFNFGPDDRKPSGDLRWHRCPFGKPGDLVWVRETHCTDNGIVGSSRVLYRSDCDWKPPGAKWTPAIHMPRWVSRLTLRLTDVRVERLEDISINDALREMALTPESAAAAKGESWDPLDAFDDLWDATYGQGAARANPWVWALTFEVIERNIDQVQRTVAA